MANFPRLFNGEKKSFQRIVVTTGYQFGKKYWPEMLLHNTNKNDIKWYKLNIGAKLQKILKSLQENIGHVIELDNDFLQLTQNPQLKKIQSNDYLILIFY